MCGYPLSQASPQPVVLAAPVPSPPAYGSQPVYWTNLVARSDGPIKTIDDVFGKRMAFTTIDSQSGYQAVRAFFAPYAVKRGSPLFAAMVGPLVTPRRVIEAVLAGDADVGPVDSYAFDLLQRHEVQWLAPLRVIAATPATWIPPLVGAPDLPADVARALRDALALVEDEPSLAGMREALLLRAFATATASMYDSLGNAAEEASAMGYPRLA